MGAGAAPRAADLRHDVTVQAVATAVGDALVGVVRPHTEVSTRAQGGTQVLVEQVVRSDAPTADVLLRFAEGGGVAIDVAFKSVMRGDGSVESMAFMAFVTLSHFRWYRFFLYHLVLSRKVARSSDVIHRIRHATQSCIS